MALFSTNHTLTQGSLHYRLATLGYQKQTPNGVRRPHELPLRRSSFWNGYQKQKAMGFVNLQTSFAPLFLLTRDEIKKAQRRRYYASVSMSESIITNVTTTQRRKYYANILMNESTMTNVLTTQLGTSCSFDNPGLASVASYPG